MKRRRLLDRSERDATATQESHQSHDNVSCCHCMNRNAPQIDDFLS